MSFNYKVTDEDSTTAKSVEELIQLGYRRVSNAYCEVARIDREDWLDFMAEEIRCCVADFYNKDGSGVANNWKDHYIRCFSNDVLCVGPSKIRQIPGY
jgi:hypothetical protein